jgi:hypothetical protein
LTDVAIKSARMSRTNDANFFMTFSFDFARLKSFKAISSGDVMTKGKPQASREFHITTVFTTSYKISQVAVPSSWSSQIAWKTGSCLQSRHVVWDVGVEGGGTRCAGRCTGRPGGIPIQGWPGQSDASARTVCRFEHG